jgi:hypothetical protein
MNGYWNEPDRSCSLPTSNQINFARLGNSDKIIARATDKNIEVKEKKPLKL